MHVTRGRHFVKKNFSRTKKISIVHVYKFNVSFHDRKNDKLQF